MNASLRLPHSSCVSVCVYVRTRICVVACVYVGVYMLES